MTANVKANHMTV